MTKNKVSVEFLGQIATFLVVTFIGGILVKGLDGSYAGLSFEAQIILADFVIAAALIAIFVHACALHFSGIDEEPELTRVYTPRPTLRDEHLEADRILFGEVISPMSRQLRPAEIEFDVTVKVRMSNR